jgi:flagellar biosynthesis/type III secretory pathway M-ring protein FliF/YscJ
MARELAVWLIRLLFAGLALAAVVAFLLPPLVRMFRNKPQMELSIPDYTQLLEEKEALSLDEDGQEKKPDRASLIAKARADPHRTAMLVRSWLKEKR